MHRSRFLLLFENTIVSFQMPQGYYLIEQWTRSGKDAPAEWIPILHLPFGATLTAAENALEKLGEPQYRSLKPFCGRGWKPI